MKLNGESPINVICVCMQKCSKSWCKTIKWIILTFIGEKRYQLVNDITRDGFCLKWQIRLAEQFKDEATKMLRIE